jgi:hypothetical protein
MKKIFDNTKLVITCANTNKCVTHFSGNRTPGEHLDFYISNPQFANHVNWVTTKEVAKFRDKFSKDVISRDETCQIPVSTAQHTFSSRPDEAYVETFLAAVYIALTKQMFFRVNSTSKNKRVGGGDYKSLDEKTSVELKHTKQPITKEKIYTYHEKYYVKNPQLGRIKPNTIFIFYFGEQDFSEELLKYAEKHNTVLFSKKQYFEREQELRKNYLDAHETVPPKINLKLKQYEFLWYGGNNPKHISQSKVISTNSISSEIFKKVSIFKHSPKYIKKIIKYSTYIPEFIDLFNTFLL